MGGMFKDFCENLTHLQGTPGLQMLHFETTCVKTTSDCIKAKVTSKEASN